MKILSYILFYLLSCTIGLTSGILYTLLFSKTEGQGLAAGGILVFNSLVACILAIVLAIITTAKIENKKISTINKVVVAINLIGISLIILIIKFRA